MNNLNLQKIKDRRLDMELSMQDMAENLGFKNASTYLKYESGEYAFKANMLPKLAKVLNLSIENFFN